MGGFEARLSGLAEPKVRHHPLVLANLTVTLEQGMRPWQPVSFTGAVSSQRVTEEREVVLSAVGNRVLSV